MLLISESHLPLLRHHLVDLLRFTCDVVLARTYGGLCVFCFPEAMLCGLGI